jgi:polysaccharide biosynthesis protein PslG
MMTMFGLEALAPFLHTTQLHTAHNLTRVTTPAAIVRTVPQGVAAPPPGLTVSVPMSVTPYSPSADNMRVQLSMSRVGQAPVRLLDVSPTLDNQLGFSYHEHLGLKLTPATLDDLRASGVKFLRFVIPWDKVEGHLGKYEIPAEHAYVLDELRKRRIRPIIVLAFSNSRLYGMPRYQVRDPEDRKAFVQYAAHLAKVLAPNNPVFEVWNEPNLPSFWPTLPDETLESRAVAYTKLLVETGNAIRAVNPKAPILGPALAGEFSQFMVTMINNGALNAVDAISIHPYRKTQAPEVNLRTIGLLRQFMDNWARKHSPSKVNMPIVITEFGYSAAVGVQSAQEHTPEQQTKYMRRHLMVGQMLGITINTLYSLTNARRTPCNEVDKCYGAFSFEQVPQPGYLGMKRLVASLAGYQYIKRLESADPGDYILVFTNPTLRQTRLVAWNTSGVNRRVQLPFTARPTVITDDPVVVPSAVVIDR